MISKEEKRYLKEIADKLPKIELDGGKTIYIRKMGHEFRGVDRKEYIAFHKLEKDWEPQSKHKYIWIRFIGKYHDHFSELCKAWEAKGNEGVNNYVTTAKNLHAKLTLLQKESQKLKKQRK